MAKKPNFKMPDGEYGGDVSAKDAWADLASNPEALFVDVRTDIELQLIGEPDFSSIDREPLKLPWVTRDGPNPNFVSELESALKARNVAKDAPIYFMCQSGGRSKIAAMQCTELGYSRALNIAEGFEGALDENKHRNSVDGWKVSGLPWTQS